MRGTKPIRRKAGTWRRVHRYGGSEEDETGRGGFSFVDLAKDMIVGSVMGGLGSLTFYKVDKAVEGVRRSVRKVRVERVLDNKGGRPLTLMLEDEIAIKDAMRVAGPSTNKEFNVFGHGNEYGIQFNGEMLDAKQIALLIKNSPQYIGGEQKVILYSCETGKIKMVLRDSLLKNWGL